MAQTNDNAAASRNLSAALQGVAVLKTDLARLLREQRTVWLGASQLLLVIAAALLVFWASLDGLGVYSSLVEQVVFPFFVPLMAIFYGAPVLVDEIERKTLTYLTLRPIPKPILYLGKWVAGSAVALSLVLGTIFLLFVVCVVGGGALGSSGVSILRTVGAATLGTAAYASVFAALGALFARSIIASVIYYLIFDLVMGLLPVVKLLTIRFHVFNVGDVEGSQGTEVLGSLLAGGSLSLSWWTSAAILALFIGLVLAAGSLIFANRQYKL